MLSVIKKRYSICMDEKDHKRILRHVKKVKAVSFSDFLVKASLKAIEQYKKEQYK